MSIARRARGFTLVELLVVVGIIALLVAILLPALNKARQSALTLKCSSNMRQIGAAFSMYAQDNKGYWPVIKWDYPATLPPLKYNGANVTNLYWVDYISKYLVKPALPVQAFLNNQNAQIFGQYKDTVMWGCPAWDGSASSASTWNNGGVSVYDPGYSFNYYPTYDYNYPKIMGQAVPNKEAAIDSNDPGNLFSQGWKGTWYHAVKWTHPSERCLVTDCDLWLLWLNPTTVNQAPVQAYAWNYRAIDFSTPGWTNIARFRHGKYPKVVNSQYVKNDGKVAFNMLYCDGHVSTLYDIRDGFRAVQMHPTK